MWDALTITDEEAAGLSELAALDLALAKDFAARARAEADPDIANSLGRAYQRMARSYRQTLALKMRLAREMACAEREARPGPPPGDYRSLYPYDPAAAAAVPRDQDRIDGRIEELRKPMHRVIWAEHEPADWDVPDAENEAAYFAALLEERLALYSKDNRFGLEPLDDHVVKLAAAMTLSTALARRWRELPDPPEGGLDYRDDEEPAWRGSG